MPLRDWTYERGWDSVHLVWLTHLLEYVQERLPEGYMAFLGGVPSLTVEQYWGQARLDMPGCDCGTASPGCRKDRLHECRR